jgi:protein-disulfide isomerase
MLLPRRSLPLVALAAALAPRLARADDALTGDRTIGSPDATATAVEFFSLTCTHCAAFGREVFPQVKAELIDTGKLRYTFKDYPLDQLALTAAMVARALPPERYEPFVQALLASQNRWAFTRGANSTEEIWKTAALAGMSRATFDATVADQALKSAILAGQSDAEKNFQIDSTPTFIINGRKHSGELAFSDFKEMASQPPA